MRVLLSTLGLMLSFSLFGQLYNPVKWTIELKPGTKGEHTLIAKATIQDGWWVYSQHLGGQDGPIPTTINYDPGDHFKLKGKNKESDNAKKGWDKFFEMDVTKFMKYFTIEQKIKVTDPSKPITGYLNYMTCNDERCLPPTDVEFELFPTASSENEKAEKDDSRVAKNETSSTKTDPAPTKKTDVAQKPATEKKKIEEKPADPKTPSPTFSNVKTFNSNVSDNGGILSPVKWTFRSEKKSEGLYEVIAEAKIDEGWHVYGAGKDNSDGPVPTTLAINSNNCYATQGPLDALSSNEAEEHDKYFGITLVKYRHDVRLSQMVKSENPCIVTGSLEFMACNNEKCLAPELVEFKIDLSSGLELVDNILTQPRVDEKGVIDQSIPILLSLPTIA